MKPSSTQKRLFIFAGEPSGDLHGAHLVKALKNCSTSFHIEGVAGPRMRNENIDGSLKMEDFEVMGLTDVLLALPKLYRHFYQIRDHLLKTRPHAIILIDYPGFNMRLAKALRKKNYTGKIIHYVSPSVWAWGKERAEALANTIDLLMTIYPFEKKFFSHTALDVEYVGNPLREYIKNYVYDNSWKGQLNLPATTPLIAIFPGSRQSEIQKNIPLLLETAALLKKQNPELVFGISCTQDTTETLLKEKLKNYPEGFASSFYCVPKKYTYEMMRDSHTALAKSGTITLELALHHRPTVVFYVLSQLNRFYAKYILNVQLDHFCIVNILANKNVFPEVIKQELNATILFHQLEKLYHSGSLRENCIEDCEIICDKLGDAMASTQAAQLIEKTLSC